MPLTKISSTRPAATAAHTAPSQEPKRPPQHRRCSAISLSNASHASIYRQVISIRSDASTPLGSCRSAFAASAAAAVCRQSLTAQLTSRSIGAENKALSSVMLPRSLVSQCVIFDLFENSPEHVHEALRLTDALTENCHQEIFSEAHKIIHWRQEGLGLPKASVANMPLHIAGLVLTAHLLFGREGMQAVCAVAQEHISARQQLDKRYLVLLLAVAAACNPHGPPCDLPALRTYCKATLEPLNNCRTQQHANRLRNLVKKIGRFLTSRQAEKISIVPPGLRPPQATQSDDSKSAYSVDSEMIVINNAPSKIVLNEQKPALSGDSLDKDTMIRGWLKKLGI